MLNHQRKSLDDRSKQYSQQQKEQISLNYTSSMKSGNVNRDRCFSSYGKPQKQFNYTNDFIDYNIQAKQQNPSAEKSSYYSTYNQLSHLEGKARQNNTTGLKNQRREKHKQEGDRQRHIPKADVFQPDFSPNRTQSYQKFERSYPGDLCNTDFGNYTRKNYTPKTNLNCMENKDSIGLYAPSKKYSQAKPCNTYQKSLEQNKQNSKRMNILNKNEQNNNIKKSLEGLNEQQILEKINRINKLNGQINNRLQQILSKMSQ